MTVFNLTKTSKVFVLCPDSVVTGGSELLHQLADILNREYGNCYIVYFGDGSKEIPSDYKKYNIKTAQTYEDDENNIIVLYEGIFNELYNIKKAQVLLWWLSVDNFYICQSKFINIFDLLKFNKHLFINELKFLLKNFVKYIIKYKNYESSKRYKIEDLLKHPLAVCNAYQSEYAKKYLLGYGLKNLYPLKDYINTDYSFSSDLSKKEDIIMYNPKKGYEFTKKLIKKAPYLNWKPIENMTRSEVKAMLEKAKVYIDFGYHPGKDRLPREAAMSGCCIITGKKGSAGVYGDIPIDEKIYKFNQSNKDIINIIAKIKFLIENYNDKINDFAEYRNSIQKEKLEFENAAVQLFKY